MVRTNVQLLAYHLTADSVPPAKFRPNETELREVPDMTRALHHEFQLPRPNHGRPGPWISLNQDMNLNSCILITELKLPSADLSLTVDCPSTGSVRRLLGISTFTQVEVAGNSVSLYQSISMHVARSNTMW